MMTPSAHGLKQCFAVTGAALLALGCTLPALADSGAGEAALTAGHLMIAGNVVQVTLFNRGDSTVTATIQLTVVTRGGEVVSARVPARVEGGQQIFLGIPIAAPGVDEVIHLGVVLDDGSPF